MPEESAAPTAAVAPQDPPADGAVPTPAIEPQEREPWQPPAPDPGDSDWVRHVSGEWLKGELEFLRDGRLEFDSDELDVFTFDWADVAELRSPRENTVVLENLETLTGTLLIDESEVVVLTASGERRFSRDDVLSIVPGDSAAGGHWSGKLSVGFTTQSGNTEQTTSNTLLSLVRRSPLSRVSLNYIGNNGSVDGTANVENSRFTGRWDLFTSAKWFFTPLSVDAYRDPFQNIRAQITPGAGVGYHLVEDPDLSWDVSVLGGWRYTRFDSVPAGEKRDDSTAQLTPGTVVEWDITSRVELDLSYFVSVPIPDAGDSIHHLVSTLSVDLWGDLDLDVTFQWDRVNNPEPDADGAAPEADDFRLAVGLGWSF